MADGSLCTVVARPNVFDAGSTAFAQVQAGQTLAQMLGDTASLACEVTIGGQIVPRAIWSNVRPKAGQTIHVTIWPQGGGNGSKWLRAIAMVVVAYLSYGASTGWGVAAFGSYAGVAGAAIGIIGMMAVNALIPPPTAKAGATSDPFSSLQSLTGTSNQANQYGVIPCVVGHAQFFPPHAAYPYSEISGDDQYLRCMFDLGYGDLDISDIKIGDTSIDSYTDVDYEITTTPTLFDNDVFEEALTIQVSDTATEQNIRTTQPNTTEISVDFQFPQGLFAVDDKGHFVDAYRRIDIDFRQVGTATWYGVAPPTPGITVSSDAMHRLVDNLSEYEVRSNANKQLRVGVRWKVAAGQYDVRITTSEIFWNTSVQHAGTLVWSAMRSFSPKPASATGTLKLAMRIKASDQLNGVIQNLQVLAQQKIPTWDVPSQTWSANTETSNPAWIYAWLLTRCPAVVRTLADSRLNLDDVADWAAECDAKGFKIGFVMDSARALSDVVRDVLSGGRASFGLRNGRYGPVRDVAQSVPVQMFTPKNSWGFNYARDFTQPAHALRVSFTNPEADWQADVVIVFADGYNAGNATIFEELDLRMVIDANAAWKLGRYYLAVMRDRPVVYSLQADIEHMVCERGDLVHVAHDIIGWGIAHGRVKSVSGNSITLDEVLELDPAKTYMIRVRRSDNTQITSIPAASYSWDSTYITFDNDSDVDSLIAPTRSFTLSTALAGAQAGDLFVVGEVSRDVAKLIVKSVEPSDDLTATITLVDYSSEVINADSGAPPTFVSQITGARWEVPPPPPTLNIRIGTSSTDQIGSASTQVGYGANATSGVVKLPAYRQVGPTGALNGRIMIQ